VAVGAAGSSSTAVRWRAPYSSPVSPRSRSSTVRTVRAASAICRSPHCASASVNARYVERVSVGSAASTNSMSSSDRPPSRPWADIAVKACQSGSSVTSGQVCWNGVGPGSSSATCSAASVLQVPARSVPARSLGVRRAAKRSSPVGTSVAPPQAVSGPRARQATQAVRRLRLRAGTSGSFARGLLMLFSTVGLVGVAAPGAEVPAATRAGPVAMSGRGWPRWARGRCR